MLSIRIWLEKLNFDLAFNVIFTEICGSNLDLVPFEKPFIGSLNLRFVNRRVFTWSNVSVKDEETQAAFVQIALRVENHDLWVLRGSDFFCWNDNSARFTWRSCGTDECFGHDLVSSCDNLMQLELQAANEVMRAKILRLLWVIITVIHLNFEDLWLLKMKVDHDFLDKLWVEVVVDSLSLA